MDDTWRVSGYAEAEVLGTGGFGWLVPAKHEASGKMAAIKSISWASWSLSMIVTAKS